MFGEIKNKHGEKIDYSFHPGRGNRREVVVLGHGVTGNKDRPFLVRLAEGISGTGIPALRISFPGNGQSEGRFGDCTISKEVDDLGAVFGALEGRRICYAGHSMGSAVGVLRASKDQRISWLISLAGMVHTEAFAEREFGTVTPGKGFMWDEPTCPLSQAYMDDMRRIKSVVDCAAQIRVPWLLVHGTADDVVPIEDSEDIFVKAHPPKKFIQLAGANHVFAGEFTERLVETVVAWVQEQIADN